MPLVINEGVVTTVMLDPGLGHQVINTCLSVDAPDDGSDMIDKGHGFGDRIYEILLHLQSKTMALLGPHTRTEQRATGIPRAMVEFYEDFCNNGGIILPTIMPEDVPDLTIKLGEGIHHHKGYDATGSDIRNKRGRVQTYRGDALPM